MQPFVVIEKDDILLTNCFTIIFQTTKFVTFISVDSLWLWNALPPINIHLHLNTIKAVSGLYKHLWDKFYRTLNPNNLCICLSFPLPLLYAPIIVKPYPQGPYTSTEDLTSTIPIGCMGLLIGKSNPLF